LLGRFIERRPLQGNYTPIVVKYTTGVYVFVLKDGEGNKREFRIIIEN